MSSIDIRIEESQEVTEIVFANEYNTDGCYQAYRITNCDCDGNMLDYFTIEDRSESVIINSKEHAQNLIKALNKAIELGWVK